jgi:hypothetical protein
LASRPKEELVINAAHEVMLQEDAGSNNLKRRVDDCLERPSPEVAMSRTHPDE